MIKTLNERVSQTEQFNGDLIHTHKHTPNNSSHLNFIYFYSALILPTFIFSYLFVCFFFTFRD